jgi:hypothetical protein
VVARTFCEYLKNEGEAIVGQEVVAGTVRLKTAKRKARAKAPAA